MSRDGSEAIGLSMYDVQRYGYMPVEIAGHNIFRRSKKLSDSLLMKKKERFFTTPACVKPTHAGDPGFDSVAARPGPDRKDMRGHSAQNDNDEVPS